VRAAPMLHTEVGAAERTGTARVWTLPVAKPEALHGLWAWVTLGLSAVVYFGIWIAAVRAAGWGTGLFIGWVASSAAVGVGYVFGRRAWWAMLIVLVTVVLST
jgi:hypothetical protein